MPREADVPYFNFRDGGSEAWRRAAACAPIGTKFPWTASGPGSQQALRVGKQICDEICPVRADCLAYALRAGVHHGTWGGVGERERRRMRGAARQQALNAGRMTLYDDERLTVEEYQMVVVIAKTKFVPHLAPGEVGEVEDPLARVAVRNGYAALVGNVKNFDEWMYNGAELVVEGRTTQGNRGKGRRAAKKPQSDMVASPSSLSEAPQ